MVKSHKIYNLIFDLLLAAACVCITTYALCGSGF